ncbi:hypothetical protein Ahy_B10g104376 isoform B [Arachis hypogaea]|uniref:Uncharacterized protein n=1 Tax=Arachis hypogaea TaxID=3818 RepID=A0A444X5C0_ARAHY|nr:hypothetical protein Ahy_B10g104376 isoform B [Arachis hypogaea]
MFAKKFEANVGSFNQSTLASQAKNMIKIRFKILSNSLCGAVTIKAKRVHSSWVTTPTLLKKNEEIVTLRL